MKLPDKLKPQFCCSKDSSRYILEYACCKDGMVMATNGKMMVAALTEKDEWDEDASDKALIPVAALKVATKRRRKGDFYCQGVVSPQADHVIKVRDSLEETRLIKTSEDVDKFPNVGAVTPSDLVGLTTVTLNAKMLWELAQALGTEGVCLHFKDDGNHDAIIAQATSLKDRIGLIMPMRGGYAEDLTDNKALKRLLEMKEKPTIPKEKPSSD
jgi:hypothetical protein